jgi:hypothetical protein
MARPGLPAGVPGVAVIGGTATWMIRLVQIRALAVRRPYAPHRDHPSQRCSGEPVCDWVVEYRAVTRAEAIR